MQNLLLRGQQARRGTRAAGCGPQVADHSCVTPLNDEVVVQDEGNREAKALQLRVRKQLAAANKRQASLYSSMFKSRPAADASQV